MKQITLITVAAALVMLLAACDPFSEASYTAYNYSDSIVTIKLGNDVQYLHQLADTNVWRSSNEESECLLRPKESMFVRYTWTDASVGSHTPLWEKIASIQIGDQTLSPEKWEGGKQWQTSKSGGHLFSFGETWTFQLFIDNEDVE